MQRGNDGPTKYCPAGLVGRRAAVLLHADQLRRQGNHRAGCGSDHAGPASDSPPVRTGGVELLPAVRCVGSHRRFCLQPRASPLGPDGHGVGLGPGAVPHGRHDRSRRLDWLPRGPWGRRRSGISGCAACDLQMVPQRAANRAHRRHCARRRHRHRDRLAAAQSHYRPVFLALGLCRARRCRPDMDGGLGAARPRRGPGASQSGPRAVAGPHPLPPPAAEPDDHRELVRVLRRLLGIIAQPVVAGGVFCEGPWHRPKRRRSADLVDLGSRGGAGDRYWVGLRSG